MFNLKNVVINTFNVNGLRNEAKRKDLFRYFKNHKLDLIFLQETHSTIQDEQKWKIEWGGQIWFNHGLSNSRGVAVLLPKRSPIKIEEISTELEGRLLILQLQIGEIQFVAANLYGPNEDNDQFFAQAFELIEACDDPNIMLCGDFNIAINARLDTNSRLDNHKKKRKALLDYMDMRELGDTWRVKNPNKFQYSWKRDRLAKQCSRLDYILLTPALMARLNTAEMHPGYKSDHWRVEAVLNFETHKRGRGFWKFNTSHLKDKKFISSMEEIIDINLWNVKPNITPAQNWELLKLDMTSHCIQYSINKAKEQNQLIQKLEKKIQILNQRLLDCDENDTDARERVASKITQIQEFLQNEHEDITQRIKARNKIKWHNHGERNTKFFFNLAKSRYNSKVVNRLRDTAGTILHNPKEIMQELKKAYQNLFKETRPNRQFSYQNNTEAKLSDQERFELDKPLECTELTEALKSMEDGKTPGNDGLSAEFYKAFWPKIKHVVHAAIQYALDTGVLHRSARRGILSLLPKKDRDLLDCKGWRPLTLMNVDYKLLSKALALRVKEKLPKIISEDQTGFMAGRNISMNTRKILDIIEIAKEQDLQAVIVSVDFDSCFDRISWSAIDNALSFF